MASSSVGPSTPQFHERLCDSPSLPSSPLQPGQRFGDRGRMMREVVVDRDAVGRPDDLEPALDAGERRRPSAMRSALDADLGRDGDGRQRVPHVVRADERHLERRRTATRGAGP